MKNILMLTLIFSCSLAAQEENADVVNYGHLIKALEKIAKNELEPSENLKKEFLALQQSHNMAADSSVYREFVRVKLAFEATRDSGLWRIRWSITDKEPKSDNIWHQWKTLSFSTGLNKSGPGATATAECDELSALFAFIARSLGVKNVGLFWPTWNHTVAVWTTRDKQGKPLRIVVPTSQIFLSANATLGTKEFDPYKQQTIYDYERKDVPINYRIPKLQLHWMIEQVRRNGHQSAEKLQKRRNQMSQKLKGS